MSPYVVGTQVLAMRRASLAGSGVDLPRWEKWAIGVGALASLATLIEITYQWWRRSR